ncbi:ankyrin repeat-containing domain protein [Gorgonomyces haynaldii]|nr:ankyrin repeat-containing domain protein [Gorgonomyces haynaldii]
MSKLMSQIERKTLMKAAESGDVQLMKDLIASGVKLNQTDEDGGSSLLHAAAQNGHLAICKSLIKQGVNPLDKNNSGYTTLHAAAGSGNVELCRYTASESQQSTILHNCLANVYAFRHFYFGRYSIQRERSKVSECTDCSRGFHLVTTDVH